MSYINSTHDNHYSPGESLHRLFENLIVWPFRNHAPSQPWESQVKYPNHGFRYDNEYHREVILEQGGTNFDVHFMGLTPEDKVLLYCVYYMPMHLFSSYHIFTNHLTPIGEKRVVFIDFGCGPLTSGIADWATARQCDITYIGIDNSRAMLNKAREINQDSRIHYAFIIPFYENENLYLIGDHQLRQQLLQLLDNIKLGDNGQTRLIFNFCYLLADETSKTLDIEYLSDVLIQIIKKYWNHKMDIVYQNPAPSKYHRKWEILKYKLSAVFSSQIPPPNITHFSYNRLTNGTRHPVSVYYDILRYEPI